MILRRFFSLAGLCLVTVAPLTAQGTESWDPLRALVDRKDLVDLHSRLKWVADSSAYSIAMRGLAQRLAVITQARLDSGDFTPGDRVYVVVENDSALTDSFTVTSGRVVTFRDIGVVSLRGVLRAELEPFLTRSFAKYLRQPVVHARTMLPVSILGALVRPGFYNVPTDLPLTSALTLAGGPAVNANLQSMYIERNGTRLWEGQELQLAINTGLTLDQMGLRGGDQIQIPAQRTFGESTVRTGMMLLSIPLTIYSVSQIFSHH